MGKHEGDQGGRPQKEIDYSMLDKLCQMQCTGEECAALLGENIEDGIDYDTLNAVLARDGHVGFSDYFKKKSANGKASLRRVQFKNALDGSVPMQIWLGKQYLGQQDKSEQRKIVTVTNSDPIKKDQTPKESAQAYKDMLKDDVES